MVHTFGRLATVGHLASQRASWHLTRHRLLPAAGPDQNEMVHLNMHGCDVSARLLPSHHTTYALAQQQHHRRDIDGIDDPRPNQMLRQTWHSLVSPADLCLLACSGQSCCHIGEAHPPCVCIYCSLQSSASLMVRS